MNYNYSGTARTWKTQTCAQRFALTSLNIVAVVSLCI